MKESHITSAENEAFKNVTRDLEDQVNVITDGYDPTPRPSLLEEPKIILPSKFDIPLGHVALNGGFED